MRVFVTGAAGFIGSVVAERLIDSGHQVVGFDSLKYGHREALHPSAGFVEGDLRDRDAVADALSKNGPFDAVFHLAAEAYIDESIIDPGLYFAVNMAGGLNLLDAMVDQGIRRMVFSSTAAVYGEPVAIPIIESNPKDPVNAYGESKLQFERAMAWYHRAHGINHVSLRYFNACGATNRCGEARRKETHIIPLLFDTATGKRQQFTLFGTDYDTLDGTCLRDYVHVIDIANAHILAVQRVDELKERAYNLGSGSGFSNLQIIEAVRQVTGKRIDVIDGERRPGDPARLVASYDKIQNELGWTPEFKDPVSMVETSWNWRLNHPNGYSL